MVAGGAVAVAVAIVRTGTAVALERFRLLVGVADASESASGPEAMKRAMVDVLVPAFAATAAIDDGTSGAEPRRPAARPRAGDRHAGLTGRPARYSQGDLRFAEVLAGRVALALDNAGLTSELTVAEEQFGVVVRTLAEAVTVNDAEGRIVYANEAAVELLRLKRRGARAGRRGPRRHGPLRGLRRARRPLRARATCRARGVRAGERDARAACSCATSCKATRRGALAAEQDARRCATRTGRSRGVVNVIEDVTRGQARRARAAAAGDGQRGARLLAGLRGDAAARRRGRRAGVRRLVRRRPAGARRRAAARRDRGHRAGEGRAGAAAARALPGAARRAGRCARVCAGSRAELVGRDHDEQLAAYARDERAPRDAAGDRPRLADHRAAASPARRRSAALTLATHDPGRRFDDSELRARRGARPARRDGGARTRARYTARARRSPATLQRGLRPPELLGRRPAVAARPVLRAAGELQRGRRRLLRRLRGPRGLDARGRRRRRPGRRGGRADVARALHAAQRRPSSRATSARAVAAAQRRRCAARRGCRCARSSARALRRAASDGDARS